MSDAARSLAKDLKSRDRKTVAVENRVLVSHKYDEYGNVLGSEEADPVAPKFSNLTISEAQFLKALQKNSFDVTKACEESGRSKEAAKRLMRKLSHFVHEYKTDTILAEVPTTEWIKARHVENILEGGDKLKGTSQESLKELRAITMPKEKAGVTINNVIAMPQLAPEVWQELRLAGDQLAEAKDVA